MKFFPTTIRTHGSILLSQTKPEDIPAICLKNNFMSAPLTDISSLSQCVRYAKVMEKAGLKPVFGLTLTVDGEEVLVYARNQAGWKELLNVGFQSNKAENLVNPRLTLEEFQGFQSLNLIIVSPPFIYKHLKPSDCSFPGLYPRTNMECDYDKCVVVTPNFFEREKLFENTLIRCKGAKTSVVDYDNSNKYDYIHNEEDLLALGVPAEVLQRNSLIFDLVEPIEIKNPQKLPDAQCPDGLTQKEYLKQLCLEKCPQDSVYRDRLTYELEVIGSADMEGYFLIVRDIVQFIKDSGYLSGAGRGSAAGCLISYLIGITSVDPIRYNLMFERFYTADRGSLPDIDLDMPEEVKDALIQYLRMKYGEDRFAQLCTFSTFKGAAALKTVFSARGGVTPAEQNEITKELPMESKIIDELEQQHKEFGTKSILYWTLRNKPKLLSKWCTLKEDRYDGVLAAEFEDAVQLESVISGRGRHASAFVLSNSPLHELAPVVFDSVSGLPIIGVDMYGAEDLGLVKIDLLGLNLLSKCQYMRDIINGKILILPST